MRTIAAGLLLAAATMTTGGTAVAADHGDRQCTVEGDGNTVVAPFCGVGSATQPTPPQEPEFCTINLPGACPGLPGSSNA